MLRGVTEVNDPEFWTRASRPEVTSETRTGGSSSGLNDSPMSLYWRDLAALYPGDKVLLTVRDPVRWFTSSSSPTLKLLPEPE